MTVIVTIEIRVSDKGMDVNSIERSVEGVLEEARPVLWQVFVEAVENPLIDGGGVAKQRRRERTLMTTGGVVKVSRYVVKDAEGNYYCPVDRALGLAPRRRATEAVVRRGCELSAEHSYRPAAELLGREVRGSISHMSLWKWAQRTGETLRLAQEEEREAVFGLGQEPARAAAGPAFVVGEMDGTMIRLQRRAGHTEIKCGILYSHKEETWKRRRRVADKVTCAALEPMDDFAERWWLAGERSFRISEARRLLLITDGLDIYREAVAGYFPGVVHQLDRWHLREKIHSVVQDDKAEAMLKEKLDAGEETDVVNWLKRRSFPGREEKHAELINYFQNNRFSINAVKTISPEEAPSSLRRVGSGAIEKTVGVLITKRFKGQGRSWSLEGARNLLAVRTFLYNSKFPLRGEHINRNPKPIPVSLN